MPPLSEQCSFMINTHFSTCGVIWRSIQRSQGHCCWISGPCRFLTFSYRCSGVTQGSTPRKWVCLLCELFALFLMGLFCNFSAPSQDLISQIRSISVAHGSFSWMQYSFHNQKLVYECECSVCCSSIQAAGYSFVFLETQK